MCVELFFVIYIVDCCWYFEHALLQLATRVPSSNCKLFLDTGIESSGNFGNKFRIKHSAVVFTETSLL